MYLWMYMYGSLFATFVNVRPSIYGKYYRLSPAAAATSFVTTIL